jgi:large subunit ribosomal protein L24
MRALKQRFTRKRKEIVIPRANKNIRKGDIVEVITGGASGKSGKVLRIITKTNRCIVEKVNMVKKHRKPTQTQPNGGIDEIEASIHLSNVVLITRGTAETKETKKKAAAPKAEKTTAKKKAAKK